MADDTVLPVLRFQAGDRRCRRRWSNRLAEHTSIHWHGIRLPNAQDGVPYLTQQPVRPGEQFVYEFAPPDTGTFFFHPHCNTAEQLGRGLVRHPDRRRRQPEPYDADARRRDARLGSTMRGSSCRSSPTRAPRGGTFGSLRTVNGEPEPDDRCPAPAATCGCALLNIDNTRVMELGVEGADAALRRDRRQRGGADAAEVVAPGPAMRIDVVMRHPRPDGRLACSTISRPSRWSSPGSTLEVKALRGRPLIPGRWSPIGWPSPCHKVPSGCD